MKSALPFMKLSYRAHQVMMHPAVQRLSQIHQLGFVPQVWPVAKYNRLEHSVGVALLSVHVLSKLWKPTDRQLLWIELAGLLHDVGHGPFSHAFDKSLMAARANHPKWLVDHEVRSQKMIELIMSSVGGYTKDDIASVKHLVHPQNPQYPRPDCLPSIMTSIVSNHEHGIDTDRLDYIRRDYSLARSIHDPRTIPRFLPSHRDQLIANSKLTEDGKWVFSIADARIVQRILRLRTTLYRCMYLHPLVLQHELTFREYLGHAIRQTPEMFNCLEFNTVKDCLEYVTLTQRIMQDYTAYQTASPMYRWLPFRSGFQILQEKNNEVQENVSGDASIHTTTSATTIVPALDTKKGSEIALFHWQPNADKYHQYNVLVNLEFHKHGELGIYLPRKTYDMTFPEDKPLQAYFKKRAQ